MLPGLRFLRPCLLCPAISHHWRISTQHAPTTSVHVMRQVSNELGLELTPFESTVVDMAVTMLQLGIAKPVSV